MSEWNRVGYGGWQALPKVQALFYVVPKNADEAPVNTNGEPILGQGEPRIMICRPGCWSSLDKATHWLPLPAPPETRASVNVTEELTKS